ncbi:MAG: hypothetical protein GKR89_14630 [Candidatus Latescibacteria bacterium]|nr:hypothetical protein [Candidatus Latescibacterota bacterium]
MSPVIKSCLAAVCLILGGGLVAPSYGQTQSPHQEMDLACSACHTTAGWRDIRFDHEETGFPLLDRHAEQGCLDCHRVEDFTLASPACSACHLDHHQGALEPQCGDCHDTVAWNPSAFVHDMTAFPLWGAHQAVDCVQCHANEVTFQFGQEAETCFDCHAVDFARPQAAVHLQAATDCETCHTQDQWRGGHDPAAFEIRFGPHEVSCSRCHKFGDDYMSYTCADCHEFPLDEEEHRGIDAQDARCMDCHTENEVGDFEAED